MKKWIICKYGQNHAQNPYSCTPIGIAIQKTFEDSKESQGFINISQFESWLIKKDLCAFGEGYAKHFPQNVFNFPVMYAF